MKINWVEYESIGAEISELAMRKNKDYGTQSLTDFGTRGIVIRLVDKVNRLKTLIWNEEAPRVETEKIEDTCKDIVNYAVYLIMMERNKLVDLESVGKNKK
jgi:hypothetical protein